MLRGLQGSQAFAFEVSLCARGHLRARVRPRQPLQHLGHLGFLLCGLQVPFHGLPLHGLLASDDVEDEVSGVVEGAARVAHRAEVAHALPRRPVVDDVAFGHDGDGVEHLEDLEARLVDAQHDRPPPLGKVLEEVEDAERCRGVKPCGRLIQKQDRGRRDQLHADVDTLAFAARDPADEFVANRRVCYLGEPELLDHLLDTGLLRCIAHV
mmetsp:Transcript_17562/g.35155  ORF Transcript_17562/g.35155 Transcript_17562/m.35155 type:complete len:210 (+) Transcript_17562:493-1122(+)